jgi:cytochrome c biogenesis protein CcmG/thiol:disulfide interchange protein DsbE
VKTARALAGSAVFVALLLGGCSGETDDGLTVDSPASVPSATPTPKPSEALPDLCPPRGEAAVAGPKALPELSLHCLGADATRDLRRLAGRPMLINVWASWCGPCKVELPLLARAHREWENRVAFLGIDAQDASAEAWKSLTAASIDYPQLEDPEGRTRAPLGWHSGVPLTMFVDARGRIVGTERTAFRTYPDVVAAIHRHLGDSLAKGNP